MKTTNTILISIVIISMIILICGIAHKLYPKEEYISYINMLCNFIVGFVTTEKVIEINKSDYIDNIF